MSSDIDDEEKKKKKSKKPKTKTAPDKGGSGKPPRPITAATGGGGRDDDQFHIGEAVSAKVIRQVPGGYEVYLYKTSSKGMLFTQHLCSIGSDVIALYASTIEGVVQLRHRDTGELDYIWQDQVDDKVKSTTGKRKAKRKKQKSTRSDSEKIRRSTDMMICPMDKDSYKTFKISDYDPQWLIFDLAGGQRTGCLKLSNDIEELRGAMIFFKGRIVGAIYVSKACIETKPTEEALDLCLKSLKQSDTTVMLYDLPEELVLSFSSLFLGYPVNRMDSYASIDYYHYITDWCQKERSTITIALSFEDGGGRCFGFVYNGRYIGAFHVEEQEFSDDQEFLTHLMDLYPHSTLGVAVLPPEMTSSVVLFGFDLEQAWNHLEGK